MKYFFALLALLATLAGGGVALYQQFSQEETHGQQASITISADDIRRIVELNGASVRVTVATDTAYVAITTKSLFGVKIDFLTEAETNRLIENRTFLIKAGCTDLRLEGTTINISQPEITSREHLADEYTQVTRTGIWNPVTMKQIEIASRDRATAKAIENGLLDEARFGIEAALLGFLPPNYSIQWK